MSGYTTEAQRGNCGGVVTREIAVTMDSGFLAIHITDRNIFEVGLVEFAPNLSIFISRISSQKEDKRWSGATKEQMT
ncbi:hypothetical protein E1B28_002779 [Marasmius oreades]|uniref:Uncharacterized protein n=1 Tax=Marasmius oreades TaxID=181124 RepID=A0A9P7RPB1_9AGAR|nr:uncharacterized protein E1B28_002779 [Marasmius oreades]KAG7086858.1 hypothetical protein E1B28_002779 [Marasmius oreades]